MLTLDKKIYVTMLAQIFEYKDLAWRILQLLPILPHADAPKLCIIDYSTRFSDAVM